MGAHTPNACSLVGGGYHPIAPMRKLRHRKDESYPKVIPGSRESGRGKEGGRDREKDEGGEEKGEKF